MTDWRLLAACAALLSPTLALAETPRQKRQRVEERIECALIAAEHWGIPKSVLLAVAEIEGGRPGQRVRNRNGTQDVGSMQFNTRYIAHLTTAYGITAEDVAAPGCYPFELAAWRLSQHLRDDSGDAWSRLANYHSRTKAHNDRYRARLVDRARRWETWLKDKRGESVAPLAVFVAELQNTREASPPMPGAALRRQAERLVSERPWSLSIVVAQNQDEEQALLSDLRAVRALSQ